jgi:hypothetical protein
VNGTDALVAATISVIAVLVLVVRRRSFWKPQFDEVCPDIADQPDVDAFIRDVAWTPVNDEMPPYLYDRLAEVFGQINENLKDLDSKASALLGFLGGGIGLFSLASGANALRLPHPTWLLGLAIVALFGSILCAIRCLQWRRRRGMPKLVHWSGRANIRLQNATKARLALYASLLVADRISSIRKINIAKAYNLELSQMLFAVGAFALLLNITIVTLSSREEPSTGLHCTIVASAGGKLDVSCPAQKGVNLK